MAPTPARGLTLAHAQDPARDGDRRDRPFAFLVSTTSCARRIHESLGASAYSYYFVLEALAPVLERFGIWRMIEHPESRLAYAAAQAEAEGFQPVHMAINQLQDVYLSPALPNIVFPFWEFPDIPDRDFGCDVRQNWARTCRPASLILTGCRFTAEAFRRAGVRCPVAVVPIPLAPEVFALPEWDPRHTWTLTCRHEVLGPTTDDQAPNAMAADSSDARAEAPPRSLQGRAWRFARGGFRKIAPWMDPETVGRLTRLKRRLASASGRNLGKRTLALARDGYRRHVRRWLSQEAIETIAQAKKKALALVGRTPDVLYDPPLPSGALTLGGGLVYLSVFNIGDKRKNYLDIVTAFLFAFRDRADVTLVIKLVTNRASEHHDTGLLREKHRSLGLRHLCRVAVITEFLTEAQMNALYQVSTFYVNASLAEGACLPLMRALASGRPAIAPDHSAMADYMDDQVGFVPRSFAEPTYWPHDPEGRLETFRHQPVWTDLRDAFLASAEVAERQPDRYQALARTARARMAEYAGRDTAAAALREALDLIPDTPSGALGWASYRLSGNSQSS